MKKGTRVSAAVRRRVGIVGILGIVAAAVAAFFYLGASTTPTVVVHTTTGKAVSITVEIASTPATRERGLMFRHTLPPSHGMLFVFPREADHAFWMKNTPLSLDIVFIDGTGHVVGIQANTEPYSLRQVRVGRRSRYALEVVAGFCARRGIRTGDRIELPGHAPAGSVSP